MVAPENVSELASSHNSTAPLHGVITLCGYLIQVRVERGHLIIEDGIGTERQKFRLSRVGHGLKRLVVVGSDGIVSLAALRWLSDQNVSFAMLERSGKVMAVTGPVSPSDAKLRRAQARAFGSEVGLTIARELIRRKLIGQEQVSRDLLHDSSAANQISGFVAALADANQLDVVRNIESQAAAIYWGAFRDVPVMFPTKDLPRVPEHWRIFGTRKSLLTGSPRLAVNSPHAMLNYLYSLLESESRLAAAALGLDPGLGFLHVDTTARDSLACDLMEAVRPQVDRYVLTWILSQPLRREWFFEERNGNCRLMAPFTRRLSETVQVWGQAVAPIAEWVARQLWVTTRKRTHRELPPTRLTRNSKREAKGKTLVPPVPTPRPDNSCLSCGRPIARGSRHCAVCVVKVSRGRMLELAQKGRIASKSPESRARVAATQHRQALAWRRWDPSSRPPWLTLEVYNQQIKPALPLSSISQIANNLKVSIPYAANIRLGKRRPHQRHWEILAQLAGISGV